MKMTKTRVKKILALKSDSDLARYFDIDRRAVHQWPQDGPIPERRQWELYAREPGKFGPTPMEGM